MGDKRQKKKKKTTKKPTTEGVWQRKEPEIMKKICGVV